MCGKYLGCVQPNEWSTLIFSSCVIRKAALFCTTFLVQTTCGVCEFEIHTMHIQSSAAVFALRTAVQLD